MADANQNYFTTSAPLVAGVVVVCGIGGGDVRGYFSPRSIWRQEKNCGDSELSQSKASPDPKLGRAVHLIAVATQDGSRDGTPRKLLVQANRNRFFSVLDRLLSAKPSVEKLTWASEVNSRGRAGVKGQSGPGTKGTRACPELRHVRKGARGMGGRAQLYGRKFAQCPVRWTHTVDSCNRYPYRQPSVAVCESGFRRIAIRHDDHSGRANVFR